VTWINDFIALFPEVTVELGWFVVVLTLTGGCILGCGVQRQQFGFRLLGLLLQGLSLYYFLSFVWYPFSASLVQNSYFFKCCTITMTALFSAYMLEKWLVGGMKQRDRALYVALFLVGIAAWYAGGLREVYMHIVLYERLSGVLLFFSATSIVVGLVAENIGWKTLNTLLLIQLPAMVLLLLLEQRHGGESLSLLTGWGTTVWPITFFIQYRILTVLDDLNWRGTSRVYHLISLWVLFFFCSREITIAIAAMSLGSLITQFAQPLFALFTIVLLVAFKRMNMWPVRQFPSLYLWGGSVGIVVLLLLSSMFTSSLIT